MGPCNDSVLPFSLSPHLLPFPGLWVLLHCEVPEPPCQQGRRLYLLCLCSGPRRRGGAGRRQASGGESGERVSVMATEAAGRGAGSLPWSLGWPASSPGHRTRRRCLLGLRLGHGRSFHRCSWNGPSAGQVHTPQGPSCTDRSRGRRSKSPCDSLTPCQPSQPSLRTLPARPAAREQWVSLGLGSPE